MNAHPNMLKQLRSSYRQIKTLGKYEQGVLQLTLSDRQLTLLATSGSNMLKIQAMYLFYPHFKNNSYKYALRHFWIHNQLLKKYERK